MSTQEHRLKVPARLEKVEALCEFVEGVARTIGMGDDAIYHCYLSVEEICTNVIEHGYEYTENDHVIDLVCVPMKDRLKIIVIDDAEPFNPLQLDDPDPNAPLLERHGGGWGVFFVKKYMDEVSYAYEDGRNNFIMVKKFN